MTVWWNGMRSGRSLAQSKYGLMTTERIAYDADSAPYAMRSVVINPYFDWANDRPLRIPFHQTVIYEAHVKGMTERHPDIPEDVRGTYSGLAHPTMIKHFKDLGVTAVELMPVHQFVRDSSLTDRGLSNYWGYDTIG